ncbi:MAG TPA: hypothetical protein VGM94_04950 [Galbitalea sp.]|jgi:hypothetical protein
MGETVTKISKVESGEDRYGKPTFTDTETTVDGVAVAPAASTVDPQTGATITTQGMILYLPATVSSAVDDRWRVRGVVYETEGASADWRSFYSDDLPGNVVQLKESGFVNVEN